MKPKIAIISFPWHSNGPYTFISDVLKIVNELCETIYVINGNTKKISFESDNVLLKDIKIEMHLLNDVQPKFYSAILWIIKCLIVQIKQSIMLIKLRDEIDVAIFYMAYPYYLIPLLVSKILKMRTIEVLTRSKPNFLSARALGLQDKILFNLLDCISPESFSIITDLNLEKYSDKISEEGARFIDTAKFYRFKDIGERDKIGFIGRLSYEKGVLEFLDAIKLLNPHEKLKFLVIGDGKLKNDVKLKIHEDNLDNVEFMEWVPNENLHYYLNQLKLIVLPTKHAEGLPTIILESIACGTPVLSTCMGGIPDIIKNCETGFIMENNSAEDIAKNIKKAINYPDLEEITNNALSVFKSKYTLNNAKKRWKNILMCKKKPKNQ
ncbi:MULTISPECIES: glycosyltransferase family 4 protein [Methanobacterium]|uniref:Glycosyl transferase family 1 domain-containing protein n=1 Tax=Methanobacterium bryantii TaxID=2161 RepID=A0A2A2H3T4_METBR|nr:MULTISPECIES: glycosyltransferase family 4 protein [Methanobacterium]OEC86672.1 hypothetical protein A9507_09460 [Methanobacterium sp. A39]PAV03950.1 hypothetical protein ASJ80_02735 [Methanobacterium bryantii]